MIRWNSLYIMTIQVENNYKFIKDFINYIKKWNDTSFLNEEEISILEFLEKILREFSLILLLLMKGRKGKISNLIDYYHQKILELRNYYTINHYKDDFEKFIKQTIRQSSLS